MKKQTEVTKENLKKAFWKLYERKSVEKITVKEITDLAGYNRGTFYLYYNDVYQMLDEIESALLDEISREHQQLPFETEDSIQMVSSLLRIYNRHKKNLNVLMGAHGDPGFFEKWKKQMKAKIKPYIQELGLDNEEIQDMFLEYHVSGAVALAKYCFLKEMNIPMEEGVQFISSMEYFYGEHVKIIKEKSGKKRRQG